MTVRPHKPLPVSLPPALPQFNRRKWLVGGGLTAAALVGTGMVRHWFRERSAVSRTSLSRCASRRT
jgi:hypothetical protein